MTDDLGARAPKYQRIADALRRQIRAGEYQPGDRLPSETALLERFRDQFGTLSLPTLRQAIGLLRSEGLVEAQQGIGTFIKTDRRATAPVTKAVRPGSRGPAAPDLTP